MLYDNDLVHKMPDSHLQTLIGEVDQDLDGYIDYREFMQLMAARESY